MIDDKMLAELEQRKREMAVAVGNLAGCDLNEQVEIIRNARRYLELKKQFAPFSMDIDGNHSWCWRGNPSRMKGATFDAAADRLLEGGE